MSNPTIIVRSGDEETTFQRESVVVETFPGGGAGILQKVDGRGIYIVEADRVVQTGTLEPGESFSMPLGDKGSITLTND